ncbi:MAG: cysteine protease StiP family protein [Bacillota bacterium]
METSYEKDDVTLLLKNINGLVAPLPVEEREKLIQQGGHYGGMLPVEYVPSEDYMGLYRVALETYKKEVAKAVAVVSQKIVKARGRRIVLVSLARAGIPAGILIKRYLKEMLDIDVVHYGISIIRDIGIDHAAMEYILARHEKSELLFVDGWIGKGAILSQLQEAMRQYPEVSPELAVLADPANIVSLCGTQEDFLIPSACLNSTISGLVSRTFYRDDVIKKGEFHGALYYDNLTGEDVSNDFIDAVTKEFVREVEFPKMKLGGDTGEDEVRRIAHFFDVENLNFIKPGVGETTRVLLRRVPWKILVSETAKNDAVLQHIRQLASERNVPVELYPLEHYKVCGIIRRV